MITVTAGDRFTDIDAYASAVAYAELLNLEGQTARAVLAGELNYSIPNELRAIEVSYEAHHAPTHDERFVLVDVSDIENIAQFAQVDRVHEVIDHHPGMEQYWRERLGDRSDIEPIGASCTQIYERWVRAGRIEEMGKGTATLLAAGILDNTLHFTAKITGERDRVAYAHVLQIAHLPATWAEQYFSWCQRDIEQSLSEAIRTDTKRMQLEGWPGLLAIGQLAVWNAEELSGHREVIRATLRAFEEPWMMNIMSIRQERNYIVVEDDSLQAFVAGVLGVDFVDGVAQTDRLWLRKEVMQAAIDKVLEEG